MGCGEVMALSQPDIYISTREIPRGDISLIRIRVEKGEIPKVTWMKRNIYLVPGADRCCWQGFLAVDLMEKPGTYQALVKISPSGIEKALKIRVIGKDYGVRRLTLPKKMVDLDPETLKRVKKESGVMKGLWKTPATSPAWIGHFIKPVSGEIVGPFGRRSVINNQPRSPHTGVDLRGAKGTPVKAINNGKVVLTSDHFFTGRTVVMDHGGEILSMYFHLDKILVKQGDRVVKGGIIGHVGATGRATGPHLHWGMRINGARISPLRLLSASKELEE
ncbi:MAG: M23 family metallopeptidase [Deltaproteobacteria bacterium]|nr:M23 family metallopeptidase [Deltaproteobacteria bacterium]